MLGADVNNTCTTYSESEANECGCVILLSPLVTHLPKKFLRSNEKSLAKKEDNSLWSLTLIGEHRSESKLEKEDNSSILVLWSERSYLVLHT